MGIARKPFQGVLNIIRFNWHFYVLAAGMILLTVIAGSCLDCPLWYVIGGLAFAGSMTSLLVSFYIYDLSALYRLDWIDVGGNDKLVLNIHAGFDETSELLAGKYSGATLKIIDFYDPVKHTEVSIKRARKRYPGLPQTVQADPTGLPVEDASADKIFVLFSAHEIRDREENVAFFKELARCIRPGGKIYITEHLRDTNNFIAYNIGFFHFYSRRSWLDIFDKAGLRVMREIKLTPFISTFIITGHDHSL